MTIKYITENNVAGNFLIEVAKGNIEGHSIINKFGFNDDIDTGTAPEDVWGSGGLYTGFDVTSSDTVTVVSTDALDTSAGTGAREVHLSGLDSNYEFQTEIISLNGTTPVTSANSYMRMDIAHVESAGSGGKNSGTIKVAQSSTPANIFARMPANENQTHICAYTVPAGKTGYLLQVAYTITRGASSRAEMDIYIREEGGVFRSQMPIAVDQRGGAFIKNDIPLLTLPEKTDIVARVGAVGANGTGVSAAFDILLVDNE